MASFITFKRITKRNVSETETQKYDLLFKDGNFEIRYYPPAVMASVEMKGTYESMKKNGFNMLAGYIFGGNNESKKISMTTPVRVRTGSEEGGMSFVMPSEFDLGNLPEPDSNQVLLHKTNPAYVASLRFRGFANNRKIASKKEQLKIILEDIGFEKIGRFEYLGYSSPYRMMNRRNEVVFYLDENEVRKILEIS